jgi:hypothetical protein
MPLRRPLMGISEDLKVALCPKPCKGPITRSQRRLMPDGSVEVTGELPPPLCDACPERDNPKAPFRHIEVLHGFPPPGGGVWGVWDIENAVRINVQYDDAP